MQEGCRKGWGGDGGWKGGDGGDDWGGMGGSNMEGSWLMRAMVGGSAVQDKGGKQDEAEEDEVVLKPEGHLPFHPSGEGEDALAGLSMGGIQDVD